MKANLVDSYVAKKESKLSFNLKEYRSEIGMGFVLILFFIIMTFVSPYFLTKGNMINVISQISVIGILAIGQTFVVLTAGIDLSLGAVMGLSAMLMGMAMSHYGVFIGVIVALLSGAIMGIANGIFIGYLKLAPFIVTLGMMSISRSLDLVVSNGNSVTNLPQSFSVLGNGSIMGIPYYLILTILLFVVGSWIANKTKTGRLIYAIGSNEEATRLSGINVALHKAVPYFAVGILAGIAAMVQSSRLMAIDPGFGTGLELDTIAAVVIGGTSLLGGKGSLVGTAIGVMLIGFLRNGLNLIGVSPFWQGTAIGSVIILAILIEKLTNRAKN